MKNIFNNVYLKDVVERNHIQNIDELDALVDILASSIGSLTNPTKISRTFASERGNNYSNKTISNHIERLAEAFFISKASRYDIKGRKYIGANLKYYFTDVGIVEIYDTDRKKTRIHKQLEVDFVVNQGSQRYYIQVAYDMNTEEKQIQELKSLRSISDSFKKIVIVNGTLKPWRNEEGFVIMGMKYFLLNGNSLEF